MRNGVGKDGAEGKNWMTGPLSMLADRPSTTSSATLALSVTTWRGRETLHRAGLTVGERIHRELQLQADDGLLDQEVFSALEEVQLLPEQDRQICNTTRPLGSSGYQVASAGDGAASSPRSQSCRFNTTSGTNGGVSSAVLTIGCQAVVA